MDMDQVMVDSLAQLHFPNEGPPPPTLQTILKDWNHYAEYISLISEALSSLLGLDESVSPLEDISSFKMELSSLLKELCFPYSSILETKLEKRFEDEESRKITLNFLLSELKAAKIIRSTKPSSGGGSSKVGANQQLGESKTAKILQDICTELEISQPMEEDLSVEQFWNSLLLPKLKGRIGSPNLSMEPLFKGELSDRQWESLELHYEGLKTDYGMRREMLLKRLDVTIASFPWSERLKDKKDRIKGIHSSFAGELLEVPNVLLTDILAARIDLPVLEKTSSTSVRKNTRSDVNTVVIGKVPDRGGRTNEVFPPPKEMPSWKKRQDPPSASSGWLPNPNKQSSGPRSGGRGGNRGSGIVQGGWSGQSGSSGWLPNQQSSPRGGGGGNRGGGACYNCGVVGHMSRACPNQMDDGRGQNNYYDDGGSRGGGGGYGQQQQWGQDHYQHDDRYNHGYNGQSQYYNSQGRGGGGGGGGGRGRGRGGRY